MKRRIIQFTHPGVEYPQRRNDICFSRRSSEHIQWNDDKVSGTRGWNNRRSHFRKFIAMDGVKYKIKGEEKLKKGRASFWGEWEPQSHFRVENSGDGEFMVHFPYIDHSYEGPRRHNTDPYVFGEKFWYTDCKQKRYSNVRNLAESSLILFGTERPADSSFLLDTVFVVKKRHSLSNMAKNRREGLIDYGLDFATISLDGLALEKSNFGFYEALMFADDSAFHSFVPCFTQSTKTVSFHERVVLDVNDFGLSKIKLARNGKMRGAGSVCMSVCPNGIQKGKESQTTDDVKSFWARIVDHCYDQGFALGVEIPSPRNAYDSIKTDHSSGNPEEKGKGC